MGNLYPGAILRIDLTQEKITKEPTPPYARQFIGGPGIDIRILYEEVGSAEGEYTYVLSGWEMGDDAHKSIRKIDNAILRAIIKQRWLLQGETI